MDFSGTAYPGSVETGTLRDSVEGLLIADAAVSTSMVRSVSKPTRFGPWRIALN